MISYHLGGTIINNPAMADKIPPKCPRNFDGGAVGLSIVAAMGATAAKPIPPQRSEPIRIVSPRPKDATAFAAKEDDEKMSESYTCVVSHIPGSTVRKRVYFDDGSNGAFFHSPPQTTVKPKAMEFLNRCYLCATSLHGLDIFMYRGDKAFCSFECRSQQILNDEYMEKRSSGALNQFEYSVSPCSAPLLFPVGVAAG